MDNWTIISWITSTAPNKKMTSFWKVIIDPHTLLTFPLILWPVPFCFHTWLYIDRTHKHDILQHNCFITVLQMDRLVQWWISVVFTGWNDKVGWFGWSGPYNWFISQSHTVRVLSVVYMTDFYLLIKSREKWLGNLDVNKVE